MKQGPEFVDFIVASLPTVPGVVIEILHVYGTLISYVLQCIAIFITLYKYQLLPRVVSFISNYSLHNTAADYQWTVLHWLQQTK